MKLGKFVEVSIGVADLAKSLPFYERLGFEKLDQNWEPWPWAVLTDGSLTVNLSQASPGPPVISYLAGDMKERLDVLEGQNIFPTRVQERELPDVVGVMEAPSGIGISFLDYSARKIPGNRRQATCKCGTFGELAFPVRNLEESLKFWHKAEFQKKRGSQLPYPWAVVSDGLITLGLYQTADYEKPALVYYSENTVDRLEDLTSEGFQIIAEIPSPDVGTGRSVIEPPDGQVQIMLEHRAKD